MLELRGKYNTTKVFTDNVDNETISQVIELLNQDYIKNAKIRIMPDCNAGAGCVIGTTMTISDKAIWTGRVENDDILLPIQTSHDGKPIIDPDRTYHPDGYIPDWEYMEKYIKATEKEIIKEVVLYKDKVIANAKEITGEKEVAW